MHIIVYIQCTHFFSFKKEKKCTHFLKILHILFIQLTHISNDIHNFVHSTYTVWKYCI